MTFLSSSYLLFGFVCVCLCMGVGVGVSVSVYVCMRVCVRAHVAGVFGAEHALSSVGALGVRFFD